MSTEATLRAAIEDSPYDEEARQVYCDWLLEQGDPRGELMLVQLARLRDPWWAARRLERRELRLRAAMGRDRYQCHWLFDRGEEGLAISLMRLDELEADAPRWLRPTWYEDANDDLFTLSNCDSLLRVLCEHPVFAGVRRLDLSAFTRDVPWQLLLTSPARPYAVVLPFNVERTIDEVVEAPVFSQVTAVVCGPQRMTDSGLAALARLPGLSRLDARENAITARGIETLMHALPQLCELQLSLATLGVDGLAALAAYRGVARVTISYQSTPAAILALVRSPCWDGTLDLGRLGWQQATDVAFALADELPARPLVALRLPSMSIGAFDRLIHAPIARTVRHLDVTGPGYLNDALQLETLRFARFHPETLAKTLASPALAGICGLALDGMLAKTVDILARSPVRPRDLALEGSSSTEATVRLARSPVLGAVVDLTLALHGNHAAGPVTQAFVESPHLEDVACIELAFARQLPAAKQARLAARFGPAWR